MPRKINVSLVIAFVVLALVACSTSEQKDSSVSKQETTDVLSVGIKPGTKVKLESEEKSHHSSLTGDKQKRDDQSSTSLSRDDDHTSAEVTTPSIQDSSYEQSTPNVPSKQEDTPEDIIPQVPSKEDVVVPDSPEVNQQENNPVIPEEDTKPVVPEVIEPSIPEVIEPTTPEVETPVTPEVVEPSVPEVEEEPFDIDYYISFAKNYATSIGFELNSSVTESWDHPIAAYNGLSNIESGITGRLDFYKYHEEDNEFVWIWYEEIKPNEYEIYIARA